MSKTVTQIINVTAKHIAEGDPESATECPVALAIADQVEGSYPYVLADEIAVRVSDRVVFTSPPEVEQFISDFDAGLPVEPFSFALDIPVDTDAGA